MLVPRYVLAAFALAFAAPAPASETAALKQVLAHSRALPAAPQLTEEALGRRSRLREVKLSPDGASLAWLEQDGKTFNLKLQRIGQAEKKQLLAALGRVEIHWSRDGQVLFIDSGDGLSALQLKDGASAKIAAFDPARRQQFLMVEPRRPHSALVDEYDRAASAYRLSRLDADGKREVLYEGKKKLADFLLDASGQVSFIRSSDDQFMQVVQRRHGSEWIEVARCKPLQSCSLVSASADGRLVNLQINAQDGRASLVQVDTAGKSRRVLHSDPAAIADLRQVVLAPGSQQPELALYDVPARRIYGLNPAAARAAADIARRFGGSNITVGLSDGARWLLTERGARLQQERYWLYDRNAHAFDEILQQERALGDPLPEQQLASKIALDYRASDGAMVHGYLSLPPGRDPAALPMLTMVHGGPWGKFDNDYSTLVQLLVNRGFAVFMPNFRSSTGYGEQYMLAPKSDFGNGRVQADIIEGVRYLLANGVGDRKRLAIIGDSFGGYSTLMALSHTPDLFQFGMATVPPTDFGRTMQAAAKPAGADGEMPFARYLAEVGIALDDPAALKRLADESPSANAGKVARPLLIIAGAKDDKVDIAEVGDYVARLQGLQRPVSLLVAPDEGHHLRKPMTRQAYVYLLLKMLEQHLGGPAVAAPDPELAKYLEQAMKANGALAAPPQKVALGQ
jgi:dipeptidyl aminopeptidase/acylaminoacyl peptidase